jgi:hypothetical protein
MEVLDSDVTHCIAFVTALKGSENVVVVDAAAVDGADDGEGFGAPFAQMTLSMMAWKQPMAVSMTY